MLIKRLFATSRVTGRSGRQTSGGLSFGLMSLGHFWVSLSCRLDEGFGLMPEISDQDVN